MEVIVCSPRDTESAENDTSYLDEPNSAKVFLRHLEGRLFTRKLDAPFLVRSPLERQTKRKQGKDEHTQSQEGVDVQVLCRKGGGSCRPAGTDLPPLTVVGDHGVLALVDELGERDVSPVAEDVHSLSRVRAVRELETEEVACVGGRTADELNHQAGGRVRDSLQFRISVDDIGRMEEGNEGVVGRLDEEQLQRVSVKGNAFEGSKDSV